MSISIQTYSKYLLCSVLLATSTWSIAAVREYHLNIDENTVNVTGKAVKRITVNGQFPAPLLEFEEGDEYINFGKTMGGKYCVFKISHTADAMQKAWLEVFTELAKRNYEFDDRRPVMERYAAQMINKHYCEICVPIL